MPAILNAHAQMFNSKHQSPCLVSSWLFTPCSSPSSTSHVIFQDDKHPHPSHFDSQIPSSTHSGPDSATTRR